MEWNSGNGIVKIGGKKKLLQLVCGNAIAKIGREGGGGEFVAIVTMPLPKMGGKKIVVAEIWGGIKIKKSVTSTKLLQHFHNKSQVISYY